MHTQLHCQSYVQPTGCTNNSETIGPFHQAWRESRQYSWRGVEIRYSKVVFTSELLDTISFCKSSETEHFNRPLLAGNYRMNQQQYWYSSEWCRSCDSIS